MMIGNMAAGQTSIALDVHGPSCDIVTACATGTDCIGSAFRVLQYGEADVMIAGGTEAGISAAPVAGDGVAWLGIESSKKREKDE